MGERMARKRTFRNPTILCIRIEEEENASLETIAKLMGTTKSGLLRELLKKYLERAPAVH